MGAKGSRGSPVGFTAAAGWTALALRRARVYGQLGIHLNACATETGHDYVLLDGQPNFNVVTKNVIVAGDQIVIPAKPDCLSRPGIGYLPRSLEALIKEFNGMRNRW